MSQPVETDADVVTRSWTLAVRRYLERRLPVEHLLPDRQPYYEIGRAHV